MSTQPMVQELPRAQDDRLDGNQPGPGAGERPRVTEQKIIKTTRFEVGFFVRKVVDGRVVRQWQFPPEKRRPVSAVAPSPPPVPQPVPAGGPEQAAASGEDPQVQTFALNASVPEDPPPSDGSTDNSGNSSSTTFEAGFFVRTESVSPPDYDPNPNPKDQPPSA